MQISNAGVLSNAAEWVKKTRADEPVNTKKEDPKKTGKSAAAANVSISENAGNSAEALVIARANALPEVREERVAEAKERLESGYYNTQEFNEKLAERLIDG